VRERELDKELSPTKKSTRCILLGKYSLPNHWSQNMTGYEALAMTLSLKAKGMDFDEAADTSIETMEAINANGGQSLSEAA